MNKKVLIGVGVIAAAGLAYYLWKKNEDASTEGKEEKANAIGRGLNIVRKKTFLPNSIITCRRCWVSSTDCSTTPCTETCKWIDDNGANTVTYNRPCTKTQANMKGITVSTVGTVGA